MAYTNQQANTGQFVPTTQIWDIGQIETVEISSPEFRELLVRLYQNVNNIVLSLNTKQTGYFLEEEFVNSSVYFNPTSSKKEDLRPSYRKVFNIGSVGPSATVAHGLAIGPTWSFTRIYGTVTNLATGVHLALPYVNAATPANSISLTVDATNILIDNNYGVVFDTCMVVLEYLKQ